MSHYLLAGTLAPVPYAVGIFWAARYYSGYSHHSQFLSELGASPSRKPILFNGGMFLTGLLVMIFSYSTWMKVGVPSLAIAVGLFGLTISIMGLTPCDPGCLWPARTWSGAVHQISGVTGMLAFLFAAVTSGFESKAVWFLPWYPHASWLLAGLSLIMSVPLSARRGDSNGIMMTA